MFRDGKPPDPSHEISNHRTLPGKIHIVTREAPAEVIFENVWMPVMGAFQEKPGVPFQPDAVGFLADLLKARPQAPGPDGSFFLGGAGGAQGQRMQLNLFVVLSTFNPVVRGESSNPARTSCVKRRQQAATKVSAYICLHCLCDLRGHPRAPASAFNQTSAFSFKSSLLGHRTPFREDAGPSAKQLQTALQGALGTLLAISPGQNGEEEDTAQLFCAAAELVRLPAWDLSCVMSEEKRALTT